MSTFGVNISGGEFNGTGGTAGSDYSYPTLSDLKYYADKGVDLIRLPIRWERVQDALGGPLDLSGDIALIKQVLVDAASLGMNVIIDVHNYGRYKEVAIGAVGGPTSAQFADFWKKMATEFKDYPAIAGYDLMNEPHHMPSGGSWKAAAQAATNAIRTVDMNTVIYIEGEGWSAAHTWQTYNANLIINDPAGKLVYQAHGYYDNDNSGTYDQTYEREGAYPTIGVDRLTPFVEWLKAHNAKGMIGEFGVPSTDPRWLEVQKNALDYMQANNLDATAWGGGAWGTDYHHYMARPGAPDSAYMDLMEAYFGTYKGPFDTSPAAAPQPPTFAVNDVTVNEASGWLVFTVKRSGDTSLAASVNYATADGSATAGSDYTAVGGTVNFVAGQTTALITIQLTNDTVVENPESLVINLTGATNAAIADAQGVGTINSEDTGVTPPGGFPTTPTISGSDGNDTINAQTSTVDYVDARGGDDMIYGVFSKDFTDGGTGSDTISYHWSSGTVDVDLMRASQIGGDAEGDAFINIENIRGSGRNDILRGDDGANVITGLGGQDVMSGRGGSDRFVFGSALDANGDVITDYSAADTLDFSAFAPRFVSITNDGVNTRILGDSDNDGVGDFTVTLNGVYTTVNGVTIGSSPPPAPAVAINDVTVDERAGTATFTVTRSGSLTNPSAVNFATADGTATAGSDYTALSGTVSFAAGETSKPVTVSVINDALVENPETFTVNLTGGTNVTVADAQGVGTINSDDIATGSTPPPGFPSSPTIVGTDGNNNINAGASTIDYVDAKGGDDVISGVGSKDYIDGGAGNDTISYSWSGAYVDVDLMRATQLNGDAGGDVLVNIENIRGSARNDILRGDDGANVITGLGGQDVMSGRGGSDRFMFGSGADANGDVITDYSADDTLDFSAFAPRFLSITNDGVNTRILGDSDNDGVGDFTVTLNGVHSAVNGVAVGSSPPPPPPPAPTVAINDVTVDERAGTVAFTITRTGLLTNASSMNFTTADGTATAGSDYSALSGTVSFAAGETIKTITVALIDDTLVENPETFTVNLTGGTNVTVADAQGIGTINSDDVATGPTPTPGFPSSPTIVGTDGNNTINAGASTIDYVDAKGGDDIINGVGSKDYIDGGAGTDTISYSWSGAYVNVDLLRTSQQNGDAGGDVLVSIENMTGSGYGDQLRGDDAANVINGLGGNDILDGRGGADRLTGGSGNDLFAFGNASAANGDVVTDFAAGVDKLDFRSFDADTNLGGLQKFSWLDAAAFTGVAGQLCQYDLNGKHFVAGDTNGDRVADFAIEVAGSTTLTPADLLL